MPISLEHRRVDGIHVVACAGRIVEGAESEAVRQYLDDLLQYGPKIIMNVGAVDFVDSSGLGLLVRYTMRARNNSGAFRLCAVTPKLSALLKATRLDGVFDAHETEAEAIAGFYERPRTGAEQDASASVILCLIESLDVQALVRELLMRAGFSVRSAGNLPDGLILLQVTRPKVVVIDRGLRQGARTATAAKFEQIAGTMPMIELPEGFAGLDPADATHDLLERIHAAGA
jgi:anti-sigma B factor antagonist